MYINVGQKGPLFSWLGQVCVSAGVSFALFLGVANFAGAQDVGFGFAAAMGGVNFTEYGNDVAVDASGNVYTTGLFSGTVDFDPGPGTVNLTAFGSNADIFVQKLDSTGNLVWAKRMGGTFSDYGYGIAVDASGNVYTTGLFSSTADFDPGAGIFNLTPSGSTDIFVQKLDFAGNFVWAKRMGGTAADEGLEIAVDGPGNIYCTGIFSGTADFDPGAGVTNLTSVGNRDIYVQKLDSTGNFQWAKSMGSSLQDSGNGIAVDGSGNVYTTGSFQGTADFDPGAGVMNVTSAGSFDIFVQKLDASGNFVWAKVMGGTGSDGGIGIAVDGSGNAHATGYFNDTVDFDPGAGTSNLTSAGGNDAFVQKLDTSGNFVWAAGLGGTGLEFGTDLAVDGSGNVYATGQFEVTVDFDPGAGTANLTSAGGGRHLCKQTEFFGKLRVGQGHGRHRRRSWQRCCGVCIGECVHHRVVPGHGRL